MSNLSMVKSETFGNVQCDFWQNEAGDVFMTSKQLGAALGYADPQKGMDNLVDRNPQLKDEQFSVTLKMRGTDGKLYNTRVFNEDGIYEATMLAKTDRAAEFRAWVRKILKALRTGQAQLITPTPEQLRLTELKRQELEIKAKNAEARLKNAQVRQAQFILKEVDKLRGTLSAQAVELVSINALEIITGPHSLPRPQVERTYSAEDIAKEAGVSANKIGRLANQHSLKTSEYGITVLDKSPHSDKQVTTFRYNERGRSKLLELLKP